MAQSFKSVYSPFEVQSDQLRALMPHYLEQPMGPPALWFVGSIERLTPTSIPDAPI